MAHIRSRGRALAAIVFTLGWSTGCASSSGGAQVADTPAPPEPAASSEATPPPPPAPAAMSLAAGVYTDEQASEGRSAFRSVCGECHDAIEFRGVDFMFEWEGSTVGRFVRLVSETMPDDNPGSVPLEQVVAVAAYVLQLNDYPAGTSPLTTDLEVLSGLRFERPDGGIPTTR